ncbi:MAG: hypothetical protein BWX72_01307 [Firmicutes bacterium ADurb.Bin080]|jgi:hypothetical protein|nr:hypothetical protein [Clostridiales bacterium]OQC14511.1 MAG: hypothetical protein BWX72_01307 [Firmicutes bacterium ADurb.Bin080]
MKKISKKLLLIIIGSLLGVSLVLGLTLGLTLVLKTPLPFVEEVKGEPDYTIVISWEKIAGAKNYYVQYEYTEIYPGNIENQVVDTNSISIKRVRGIVKFRVKALSLRDSQSSSYSEWVEYDVEGLKLPILSPFDLIYTENGWKIDNNFSPVHYTYKGEVKTVVFYELTDNFNSEPTIVSYNELVGEDSYPFNPPPGEIIFRFRPVNFTYFNEVVIYEPIELYELYDEASSYVEIIHITPE